MIGMGMSVSTQRLQRWWTAPALRDAGFVALSAAVAVAIAVTEWRTRGSFAGAVYLVLGLAGSIALWWRRRWPLEVTVLGGLLTVAIGFCAASLLGLFTLAVRRRDRVLIFATLFITACIGLPHPWTSASWAPRDLLAGAAFTVVFALWGSYVGARRDLLESLRERAIRAEEERELRAAQARTAERSRIAREMHDVLAHKVSLIALQAGALEVNAGAAAPRVELAAAEIRSTAHQTLEDLRGVLGVLRGSESEPLVPQPGIDDLPRLVEQSRVAGAEIALETELDGGQVPDALGRTAYRIVQESLTNVRKHAGPAVTVVAVRLVRRVLSVEVTNGPSLGGAAHPLPGSGAGLIGLSERVQLAGGWMTSSGTPDGGWRVYAELPVPESD
ncbi:histidine kinase [Tsukamurella strandjordii]